MMIYRPRMGFATTTVFLSDDFPVSELTDATFERLSGTEQPEAPKKRHSGTTGKRRTNMATKHRAGRKKKR